MDERDDFRTRSRSIARWVQAQIKGNRSYHATVGTSKEKNRIRIPTETPHDRLVFADTSLDALKDWLGRADSEGHDANEDDRDF